jgi:hypothetical protein
MRRERNTTLNYATARSVVESFCSGRPNAGISEHHPRRAQFEIEQSREASAGKWDP